MLGISIKIECLLLVRTVAPGSEAWRKQTKERHAVCRICHIVPACYRLAMGLRSCQHHTAERVRVEPNNAPIDVLPNVELV